MLVFKLRAAERILRYLLLLPLLLLLLLLLSLEPLVASPNDSCIVEWHPNGTIYTLKEHLKSSGNFNWLVNGIVVANEMDPTSPVVSRKEERFIVLHSCQENVAYRNPSYGTPWNCFTSCPVTPAPKEVTSAFEEMNSTHAGNLRVGFGVGVGVGFGVLCALVVLVVLLWKKGPLKRYFHQGTAWRSCAYSAAESGVSSPS